MHAIPALVVGTGFGCRVHVPALRAAGFHIAGLVGMQPDKLLRKAQTAGVDAVFTDLDAAIDATGARVVTIATPPATHAGLAHRAIARGCHVICEKPMAADRIEAADLLSAARSAGVVHVVGNEFRFQSDRALVGRLLAAGAIGQPRMLTHVQYVPVVADTTTPMPRWWFDRRVGGGWLGASGSHIVDQVRAWLGDFASLSAALPVVSERSGDISEDSFAIRFRLRSGLEGMLQQSGGAWGSRSVAWRVAGDKGTVWIDDGHVYLADRDGERQVTMPEDLQLPELPTGNSGAARYSHLELSPYVRLCEGLRAAILGQAPVGGVLLPTFEDGFAAMQIIDAVRQSALADGIRVEIA